MEGTPIRPVPQQRISEKVDALMAKRDYPGVEEMRERAKVSLEYAMEEGLRFTIYELSEQCRPIHPDTVACYNEIVVKRASWR